MNQNINWKVLAQSDGFKSFKDGFAKHKGDNWWNKEYATELYYAVLGVASKFEQGPETYFDICEKTRKERNWATYYTNEVRNNVEAPPERINMVPWKYWARRGMRCSTTKKRANKLKHDMLVSKRRASGKKARWSERRKKLYKRN